MYARENLSDALAPRYPTSKMIDPAKLSYPFAQYVCKTERELEMSVMVSDINNPSSLVYTFNILVTPRVGRTGQRRAGCCIQV